MIKRLHLIDPLVPYVEGIKSHVPNTVEKVHQKLEKYDNKLVFHVKTSEKAVNEIEDNELDFLYIDGQHEYEYVKKDPWRNTQRQ